MSEPRGARGWLTVLFGLLLVVAVAGWAVTGWRVFILATVAAGVVLVVVAVASAIVEHQPGLVLVSAAYAGVGALLTAAVFGFAYLEESWTYVRGTPTAAQVVSCEDDGECESRWDGRTGEVDLAFDVEPGDTVPVRVLDDEAVREGGLTVLVVASSGVALVSPLLVVGTILFARRHATARHQPSGDGTSSTSSA
ncbi:hypothetical protein [Actinophytocola algeriensis]|uniref:Uncharacterized protein n=1 Tax=Actinophytocola algeriensis TaxID=1768010 RepID=A0A7W7Q6B0_9PSEU|nr:hypothetical protein [Actinophytocola algeriensis]MBB4907764.1 hypothetical protein [Actinophytocola algeriensis]MBE1479794.1 hypothetical protein [Actinophytocola algeriensis]